MNDRGQSVVQTGEDFRNALAWRFDTQLNPQGDVVESLATYTNDFDFSITPPPPHYSSSHYVHTYDPASGALVESRTQDSTGYEFVTRVYTADEQGRCAKVERTGLTSGGGERTEVETRRYYGQQLVGASIVGTIGTGRYELATNYGYDLQGRLTSQVRDGSNAFRLSSPDGRPELSVSYVYADDGSLTVTAINLDGDVGGSERSVWVLPPRCAEIWGALPKFTDSHCRFPDRLAVASELDLVE